MNGEPMDDIQPDQTAGQTHDFLAVLGCGGGQRDAWRCWWRLISRSTQCGSLGCQTSGRAASVEPLDSDAANEEPVAVAETTEVASLVPKSSNA